MRKAGLLAFLAVAWVLTGQQGCNDQDGDGYSTTDGDCDDNDSTVYPGAAELCDGLDNDCDGEVESFACWGSAIWGSATW